MEVNGVETERVARCLICGSAGEIPYRARPGERAAEKLPFGHLRCPQCGFLWLSPRPTPLHMSRFYEDYEPHRGVERKDSEPPRRFLGGVRDAVRSSILCGYFGYRPFHTGMHRLCAWGKYLGRVPFLRDRATNEWRARLPRYREDGLLLDVGCGRGDFLADMKRLGWRVKGIEPVEAAAESARMKGVDVCRCSFEEADIPDSSLDHLTMHHVLEHLFEPIEALGKCHRILKKGGHLVLYTPNCASLGHTLFGSSWSALDPPRHLYLFSPGNLSAVLARVGFFDAKIRTSARLAPGLYRASRSSSIAPGRDENRGIGSWNLCKRLFAWAESVACALGIKIGEEIEVVARK